MEPEDTLTQDNENPNGEPRELDGLDAATEAFAKKLPQEPNDDEAEPDDEPADDSDAEADEADPADDEPAEELVEVEFEGKTHKVAPELQKALLRQADYSRKMNDVTAKEKVFTDGIARAETLAESAEKYAEAIAGVRMIEANLQSLDGIDIEALSRTDPNEASRVAVRQMTLQRQLNTALGKAQEVGQSINRERGELFNAARAEMDKALQKDLKGWGDDLGAKLTKYAAERGMRGETLGKLTDPAMVIALDKARRYDELQASKADLKGKVKDVPRVVKPGQPRRVDTRADAMTAHRKSNSLESAAAAFLARG